MTVPGDLVCPLLREPPGYRGQHVLLPSAAALLPVEVLVALRKGTRSPRRSQNCAPWSRGSREGTLGLAAPTFSARRRRASSGHWPPAPNSPVSGACPRLPLAESPASPGCGRRLHGKLAARSHLRSSGPTKWLIGRPLKSPSRDWPPDPSRSLSCFRARSESRCGSQPSSTRSSPFALRLRVPSRG